MRHGSLVGSLLFCILLITHIPSAAAPQLTVEAITKPSLDVMLSFVYGGRIKEVLIKEGDPVTQGQLLASQENDVQLLQFRQLEMQAKDSSKVDSVRTEIRQKEQDIDKLEWARTRGAVTSWELDHARLDLQTAKIALSQAHIEKKMAHLRKDEMQAQLELLNIRSPVNGQVERVEVEPGESPQPLTPVIRIVKVDPLYLDVHVPITNGKQLSVGQEVTVTTMENTGVTSRGKVVHVASVADAASRTLRVKVEIPNPEHRPAGERVQVQL